MWIQYGVTVWKWLSWVLTSVTLTFDLWHWPFVWTSLLSLGMTPENFMMIWLWEHSQQGKSEGFDSCARPSNLTQIGLKLSIFQPVWPWNLMDDLKQGKSEGFESCDQPIVRKRPIWVKIGDVLSRVTLKFDGWPWKIIGHLFFAVSSFVQHFIAIGVFKLELQSGNAQFEYNSTIFRAMWPWNWRMTLKNNRAPLQ